MANFIDFFIISAYNIDAGRDVLYTCVIELTFKRYVISPTTRPPSGGSKKGARTLENINQFIAELKKYRHDISKQTLNTLRGQALSGDIGGASKGLNKVLNKKPSDSERFTNAHRSTRYMTKKYNDIDYKAQFEITLKSR